MNTEISLGCLWWLFWFIVAASALGYFVAKSLEGWIG